jgi:hypothetical protein
MAFCNACGASIAAGTKFCSKCGASIVASQATAAPPFADGSTPAVAPATPVASAPPPASGGGALKVILIVVGVIVLVGILGVASIGFFALRVAHHTRVHQDGNNVKVETPFGNVEATQDPQQAARDLGVDLYPGAQILKNGTGSATFGNIHSAAANLQSSDSLDAVSSFYKAKFPSAAVTTSDQNHCTIIASDNKSMITINLQAAGDGTRIQISKVTKSSDAAN